MIKTAVILTVFNRREVTLKGFRTLYRSIEYLQNERPDEGYEFDIYMTDDGCTDGTADAVRKEFPKVQIIQGNGNLYWSGGMRKAWQTAIDSNEKYEFYLWFNDDAELYENALEVMFDSYFHSDKNSIISGAFCDKDGNASYGGRDRNKKIIHPDGSYKDIFFINGNLVLITDNIVKRNGLLDPKFVHIGGDWDYGLRARSQGYCLVLTPSYIGFTDRHDDENFRGNLFARFKRLYSKKQNPSIVFLFNRRHFGLFNALKEFVKQHIIVLFPTLLILKNKLKTKFNIE